jgi:hypothetical protein
VGPHFDRHPAVKKLVHDPSLPINERMAAILNDLSDRVWEEMTIWAGAGEWIDDIHPGKGGV